MIKAVFSFNENTCFHINRLSALFHNASKCCGNFSTEIRRCVRRLDNWYSPTQHISCLVVAASPNTAPTLRHGPVLLPQPSWSGGFIPPTHQRSTFYSIPSAREVWKARDMVTKVLYTHNIYLSSPTYLTLGFLGISATFDSEVA